jgi:hypothetical protein
MCAGKALVRHGRQSPHGLPPHIFCRNIFRITISDRRRSLAGLTGGALIAVLTAEGNRGAVVMQLLQLHGKALRHRQHDLGQQRRPIGLE